MTPEMGWIIRKISRAKWDPKPEFEPSSISADAATIDLRTSDNRLSFWECDNARERMAMDRVVVALAGKLERADKIDVAWIEKSIAESVGILFEKTEGDTPVMDLKGCHVDAVSLDLSRIVCLARLLSNSIREKDDFARLTRMDVLGLLCKAVRDRRLSLEALTGKQTKLRQEIERALKE